MLVKSVHTRDRRTRWLGMLLYVVVVLLMACLFSYARCKLCFEYDYATPKLLVEGTAHKPYQYRVLIPLLVKLCSPLLDSIRLQIPATTFATLSLAGTDAVQRVLFVGFEIVFTFLLVIVFEQYLRCFFTNRNICRILSLSMLYLLPFNYILSYEPWYPSDIPAVFFFTLGLLLLKKRQMVFYYGMLVIATMNRETTCFLILIYLFTALGIQRPGTILFHCAAQCLVWIGVKAILYVSFQANSGDLFEARLYDNLSALINPRYYALWVSNWGLTWLPIVFFYPLLYDTFLKRALLIVIPYLIGMLFVGQIIELRIYGELFPIILTASLVIVFRLFQETDCCPKQLRN